ncbi:MAG TPA: response regulator [Planctomycetota bacterium]|nr:response regulator [Planctomycetota bacterium]
MSATTVEGPRATSTDAERVPAIMLIDDNPCDIELTKLGFQLHGPRAEFRVATDGVSAIDQLRQVIAGDDVPRPDLILLDLNMPVVRGDEVLRFIKGEPTLRSIPTVVLTSSSSPSEHASFSALGADAFLVKPMIMRELLEMMHRLAPMLRGM